MECEQVFLYIFKISKAIFALLQLNSFFRPSTETRNLQNAALTCTLRTNNYIDAFQRQFHMFNRTYMMNCQY